MIHMGAKAKLIGDVPAIELVVGRKGGALHTYDVPLETLDDIISALQCHRADAHEFFRRAGVFPERASSRPPQKRSSGPKLRLIEPRPARDLEITREFSSDAIPTPLLPPPLPKDPSDGKAR